MIVLLNMDLELEEAAAIQYINHAAMLTGFAYRKIATVLKAFAFQKIKHAITLAEQIHYLGGYPSLRVGNVHASEDNDQMLEYDFDDEQDAIWRYKIRIGQAEQLKEIELVKRLGAILWVEQRHAMYIKKQLGSGPEHAGNSTIRIIDTFDFSQKWAEKAVHVPIRIKRQN